MSRRHGRGRRSQAGTAASEPVSRKAPRSSSEGRSRREPERLMDTLEEETTAAQVVLIFLALVTAPTVVALLVKHVLLNVLWGS